MAEAEEKGWESSRKERGLYDVRFEGRALRPQYGVWLLLCLSWEAIRGFEQKCLLIQLTSQLHCFSCCIE